VGRFAEAFCLFSGRKGSIKEQNVVLNLSSRMGLLSESGSVTSRGASRSTQKGSRRFVLPGVTSYGATMRCAFPLRIYTPESWSEPLASPWPKGKQSTTRPSRHPLVPRLRDSSLIYPFTRALRESSTHHTARKQQTTPIRACIRTRVMSIMPTVREVMLQ
jgi:hypothetical protein